MKFNKGVVALPVVIGLVLMAITLPFAGKLAGLNQDNRNRAAGAHPPNCTCINGKYTGSGCVALGYACSMGPTAVANCKCEAGMFKGTGCGTNSGKPCIMPPTTNCPKGCPAGLVCKDANGGCAKPEEVACRLYGCSDKTKICTVDGCVTNTSGKRCVMDSECGGLACVNGICLRKCVMDSQCGGESCISGVCGKKVRCTKSSDCSGPGQYCHSSGYCAVDGNSCTTVGGVCITNRPPGSACDVGSMCASGKCTNGKCALPYATGTTANGSGCTLDAQCQSGRCSKLKCQPRLIDGTGCTYNSDCVSNACIGNVPNRKCAASETQRPIGSDCLSDSVCASGKCSLGKCVVKPPVEGQACTSTVDNCGPGYHCKSFKCTKDISNGGSCVFDSDCASKSCIGNVPNRKCATSENNRPNGEGCIVGSVCASGRCVGGKCSPKLVSGTCTFDSDCISDNCSGPVGTQVRTCMDKKKTGAGCIGDNECASGKCVNIKCQ